MAQLKSMLVHHNPDSEGDHLPSDQWEEVEATTRYEAIKFVLERPENTGKRPQAPPA